MVPFREDRTAFVRGEDGKRFFSSEGEDRRHQTQQGRRDVPQGGLRRAAGKPVRLRRVKAILQDVEIEPAQIFRGEAHQHGGHQVELAALFEFEYLRLEFGHAGEGPAVEFEHVLKRHRILLRIEVARVRKKEPERVADATVAVHDAGDDGGADSQFARVVGARYPQAADFRTVLVADLLRAHGVAAALTHFFAVFVDEEPVREEGLIRRMPVQHRPDQ